MAVTYDYDLFTIGAGSGGVAASRRAASYGAKVAICEGSRVGGTCVIRGCVPKKLLMYGAQFRDAFEDSVNYGWAGSMPSFDWTCLLTNKNREIDRLNGIYINMLANAGVELLNGYGRLIDRHTVEVDGRRFTARTILIATGGRPTLPPFPGAEHCITSDELLEIETLPREMVVIGGGYIAVEFASIFNALGVKITMLVRGEDLLTGFDDDVRVHLSKELRKRGIEIHTRTQVAGIEAGAGGFTVRTHIGQEFSCGQVLAATGRAPNTKGLGLEAVGVEMDAEGGIVVNDRYQTSVSNIYAIGDVTNQVALTPIAIAEGRALAETLFNANRVEISYANIPTAVFTTPPVGAVGCTEAQARARFGEVDIYKAEFRPMKHTISGRDERILMKLVVDKASDRVVGCHMVGADAPEIIQAIAIAVNMGATKAQFDRTIALHPTSAEEFVLMREPVKRPTPQAAG
ncbi:MAG TPA: glutathione-disulfide reductase [Azospirillaceae bacterium]|nr:glutathione-disulfide reductase [Azospirillaceae bacterium]